MKHIRQNIIYFALFALFICKTIPFRYYPVLDDYIQFVSYHYYMTPWHSIILAGKLYAARPLAALADVYFWSMFYKNLGAMYFILCLLHVGSCLMFLKAFEKAGIKAGIFFAVFYLFLPLTTEAAYWLSASTRIILPLFFCSVSVLMIQKKSRVCLGFVWLCNLISYCFYEPILIMSLIITMFAAVHTNRKALWIPLVNAAAVAVWYLAFLGAGVNGARSGFSPGTDRFAEVFVYFWKMWLEVLPAFFTSATQRLLSGGARNAVWLLVPAVFCALLPFVPAGKMRVRQADLLLPVMLFLLPYAPFVLLKNSWPELRGAMPSVMAAGLLLDLIPIAVFKRAVPPLLVMFSLISYRASVEDYQKVYEADQKILEYIIQNGIPKRIIASPGYVPVQPSYGQYIKALTSSDWAITGGLRAKTGNVKIPLLVISHQDGLDIDKFMKNN